MNDKSESAGQVGVWTRRRSIRDGIPLFVAFASIALAFAVGAFASPVERSFRASCDGSEQKYMVIVPEGQKTFAGALVALHGHGSDRRQFAEDGRGECKAAREAAASRNLVYVSPDYRAKCSWMGPQAESDVLDLLEVLRGEYGVSTFYFCGGSMGGTSALTFAVRHPHLVAGVVTRSPPTTNTTVAVP